MARLEGAIAATRFSLGARPGEIEAASSDPRGWLKAQIRSDAGVIAQGDLMSTEQIYAARREDYAGVTPGAPGEPSQEQLRAIRQMVQRESRDNLAREVDARSRQGATTTAPFAERWVRFWSNHFTVAARNPQTIGLVGPFEREAIRPNVFGSFAGLLGHATFHPGMLVYLDNVRSIGPSTQAAQRRKVGLNENLAREVLELHTVGVHAGYTQDDVIEFAKALTGWTVGGAGPGGAGPGGGGPGGAGPGPGGRRAEYLAAMRQRLEANAGKPVFVDFLHEPGAHKVLGKSYADDGARQAATILDDLARHPATAKHVAAKLARHFVADEPPPASLARLESTFISTGGDLSALARAVIDLDEAWAPQARKFKTPDELLTSTVRAIGAEGAFGRDQRAVYVSLAQQPFAAPSPAGWPDDTMAWSGPDAIRKRLEWANAVARRLVISGSPSDFLDVALGPLASDATRKAVARAESAEQGFTLALMSPDFQRR